MAELTRGERMVRIFVYLVSHYSCRYMVSELMANMGIAKRDLRSVQRDMVSLVEMSGGYIERTEERGFVYYQADVSKASKLMFPDFGDVMLQFVFLQRIANLYPASSALVTELVERIKESLPAKMQDEVRCYSGSLNERVLFMGPPPEFDDAMGKKLATVLKAIGRSQKVLVKYVDNFGRATEKKRTPLMIVVNNGDLYVACVSESHPGSTYTLKLRRMESVELAKETFVARAADLENIRARVRSGGMLFGEQSPNCEKIVMYFPHYARNFLTEHPYNRSMRIRKSDDYTICVTLEAEVNESLKQWVLCHGANAEVKKPMALRQMLLDSAKAMVRLYEGESATAPMV